MSETISLRPHHLPNGRFHNPWPGERERGFGGVVRWTLERLLHRRLDARTDGLASFPTQPSVRSPRAAANELCVTWIGHSSFLLQVGALNVLTDPMFSPRASPVRWAGPRRLMPPGVALGALPPIDVVLQSHDHYDHFDDRTIRAVALQHPDAIWCAPLGVEKRLRARGVQRIVERDWFESAMPFGTGSFSETRVTCVPARHFSGRSVMDRNSTLWCGWTIETAGRRVYFVGDTGDHPAFAEISQRTGPFDLVLMPIGAYDPRWFMRPVHLDPEEAVAAFARILAVHGASDERRTTMAAMHWGTFKLTDEPVDEPPRRARAAWAARGLPAESLWVMTPGETRVLGRES